jgi:hypothetical protein
VQEVISLRRRRSQQLLIGSFLVCCCVGIVLIDTAAMSNHYFNEVYERYSTTKSVSEKKDGIVSSMFFKMCKESNILNDTTFRKQDADLLYTRLKPPHQFKMERSIFRDLLNIIADKLQISYDQFVEHLAYSTRPSDEPLPKYVQTHVLVYVNTYIML